MAVLLTVALTLVLLAADKALIDGAGRWWR